MHPEYSRRMTNWSLLMMFVIDSIAASCLSRRSMRHMPIWWQVIVGSVNDVAGNMLMYVIGSSCMICVISVSFSVKEIAHRPGDG